MQIRVKDERSGPVLALCDEIVRLAEPYGALVIVNDRADLARLSGAAGVHVGQDDLPVRYARALVGDQAIVGLSTHTVAQIDAAAREAITYLAVGPVFGTGTKDTGYAPVGLGLIREACARGRGKPVVAIGGITLDRAPDVVTAGAPLRRSILAVSAASYFVLPFVSGKLEWAMAGVFAVYLAFEFAIVASLPLISELLPESRNAVMSTTIAFHAAGRMIGALAGGVLFRYGFMWNGIAAGLMTIAGIPLILWVVRERK